MAAVVSPASEGRAIAPLRALYASLLPLLIAFEYLWIPLPTTALAVPDYYKQGK